MRLSDLSLRDAATHLQRGDIAAEAYATELLDRCEVGASLNAFVSIDREGVLKDAREADRIRRRGEEIGALHGIPIAIKDVFDVAGTPTTACTPALRVHVPDRTAPLVQRLFDAGALMLGKTNMHEMAFGITSSNEFSGAVRNPHNPKMSPGGSSGGTAAAVAARMTPAGLGSDTSGSIRIPAAHCGIVGYRPSTGRYRCEGVVPMNHTRDAPGLMARRVDDIALLDGVITGSGRPDSVDLEGMRIGLPGDYFLAGLDSRIVSAFHAEVARLADLGVVFIEADPPDFAEARAQSAGPIMAWEMPRDVAHYLVAAGTGVTFEDVVRAVASPYVKSELEGLLGEKPGLKDRYKRAISEILPRHRAEYEAYLSDNDLRAIAFPTTPLLPATIGRNDMVELNGRLVSIWLTLRNSVPATLLGAPCLSLPIGLTDKGLPVGLELDGWPRGDCDLLSIGLAWERRTPQFPAPSI